MKKPTYTGWKKILFSTVILLTAALLLYLWAVPNVQTVQKRAEGTYTAISEFDYEELADETAPVGLRRVFTFVLEDEPLTRDCTLMFCFAHQNAEVLLNGERVYALRAADSLKIVRTPGANWAKIPLVREDAGAEVRVILTPVYKDYTSQNIHFYLGSQHAIYQKEFREALPAIVLSSADVLVGLAILCAALYFTTQKVAGHELYTLAGLSISLGLWNITQTDFAPMMFPGKTVLLYEISLTMLILCMLSMIRSIKIPQGKRGKVLHVWGLLCSSAAVIQLLLQLFGLVDLRELLKLTHVMIVISSFLLMLGGIPGKKNADQPKTSRLPDMWLLGVCALADIVLYYCSGNATGLLLVLAAILYYVLREGGRAFLSILEQERMLEEKETQLTLNRITLMTSQIRSHFVFNILNAISGMCKYDPELADETVVRFSRYLRSNIDIMENDQSIPFPVELQRLEDYVVLEQIRFGDKLEFYTDIENDRFYLPPLILQPIVENAIKHGISKKLTNGTIILRTQEDGENNIITVEDDGVGFDLSELDKEHSVGLRNIRFRLAHLTGGTLHIESTPGEGTVVTITIPKQEEEQP